MCDNQLLSLFCDDGTDQGDTNSPKDAKSDTSSVTPLGSDLASVEEVVCPDYLFQVDSTGWPAIERHLIMSDWGVDCATNMWRDVLLSGVNDYAKYLYYSRVLSDIETGVLSGEELEKYLAKNRKILARVTSSSSKGRFCLADGKEAEAWIFKRNHLKGIGTFGWICDVVGLNPAYARAGIRKQREVWRQRRGKCGGL